jgi:hypothetical protein
VGDDDGIDVDDVVVDWEIEADDELVDGNPDDRDETFDVGAEEDKTVRDEVEEEVKDEGEGEGEDDDVAALICKLYILSLDDPPQYSSEFP